jgi:hypothetical protein
MQGFRLFMEEQPGRNGYNDRTWTIRTCVEQSDPISVLADSGLSTLRQVYDETETSIRETSRHRKEGVGEYPFELSPVFRNWEVWQDAVVRTTVLEKRNAAGIDRSAIFCCHSLGLVSWSPFARLSLLKLSVRVLPSLGKFSVRVPLS